MEDTDQRGEEAGLGPLLGEAGDPLERRRVQCGAAPDPQDHSPGRPPSSVLMGIDSSEMMRK
ncbi:hypothetical protein P7K49_018351, partial [Saguinus oedipus]